MRRVVLVCGPPGAGKTTWARASGLDVYDRDDPTYDGDEALFRKAIARLAHNPNAQAAVIRTGATAKARAGAARACGATETMIIATPADECHRRIEQRKRSGRRAQHAGVDQWWERHEASTHATPPRRRAL